MIKTPRFRVRAKGSSIKNLLKKYAMKADEEEVEEVEESPVTPESLAHVFGTKEAPELENRGIIFISSEISKETLERASKKLLSLHFDPTFTDPIQIILNSPGGYTDAGWAFIDLMHMLKNEVRTIAMGEICSMAFMIFVAGDIRIMSPNSCAMIHQFAWATAGSYSDLVANRKAEDMEHNREITHLIANSKYSTEKDVRKHILLDKDHWLTPAEMKNHGLCDEVYTPRPRRKPLAKRKSLRKKATGRKLTRKKKKK